MRFEFNDDSQKICNSADVVNYGIQCDICGNKFQSVSNINGRRYCVGCYYKTFIKDNQQTEIDQLKQQLAEKNKELEKLKRNCKSIESDFIKMETLYKIELQRLAEYENKDKNTANSWNEMLKNCEDCKLKECIGCEHTWTCVQDIKKQFEEKDKEINDIAIQTIEILKNISSKRYENASDNSEHIICWLFSPVEVKKTLEQIKELKGENDVKD